MNSAACYPAESAFPWTPFLRPSERFAPSNILRDADGLLEASKAGSNAGKRMMRKELVPLCIVAPISKKLGSEARVVWVLKPALKRIVPAVGELDLGSHQGVTDACSPVLRATYFDHKAEALPGYGPRSDVGRSMRLPPKLEYRSKGRNSVKFVDLYFNKGATCLNDPCTVAFSDFVDS
jgi:hypothetical protein